MKTASDNITINTGELLDRWLESVDRVLRLSNVNGGVRSQMLEELRQKETIWLEQNVSKTSNSLCPYCDGASPLVLGHTSDRGIAITQMTGGGHSLIAYGYDVHGSGSNGLTAEINYCPMCGKRLKGEKSL